MPEPGQSKPFKEEKLESIIQHELSDLILRELEFDGALVTITGVSLEEKKKALVKISILPYERGPEVFHALQDARRMLQFKLLRRMKVRLIPSLQFVIEQTLNNRDI